MAALLTARTTDTTSSGIAITADGAWIEIPGTSVFAGAMIIVEASSVNTTGLYSPVGRIATMTSSGWLKLDLPSGTFVRVKQANSSAATSITVNLSPTA